MHLGGALDGPGSEKKTRFIDFCDTFHMPMIYFVDVPGFMIGPDAEREGTLRKGMRALQALHDANVPMVSVYLAQVLRHGRPRHGQRQPTEPPPRMAHCRVGRHAH